MNKFVNMQSLPLPKLALLLFLLLSKHPPLPAKLTPLQIDHSNQGV
jgi:hypothetical protein